MKFILTTITLFFILKSSFSQTYNQNDVLLTKKLYFYGYDFSKFQLADAKLMTRDLKSYIFKLSSFLDEHLPEKKLKKWFKKDTIIYNYMPTTNINKKINSDDIGCAFTTSISSDSIQGIINKYQISDKQGIGYVVIFECFTKATKLASAYHVFFDVATKKIITSENIISKNGNSYRYISDWNGGAFSNLGFYKKLYKKRLDSLK